MSGPHLLLVQNNNAHLLATPTVSSPEAAEKESKLKKEDANEACFVVPSRSDIEKIQNTLTLLKPKRHTGAGKNVKVALPPLQFTPLEISVYLTEIFKSSFLDIADDAPYLMEETADCFLDGQQSFCVCLCYNVLGTHLKATKKFICTYLMEVLKKKHQVNLEAYLIEELYLYNYSEVFLGEEDHHAIFRLGDKIELTFFYKQKFSSPSVTDAFLVSLMSGKVHPIGASGKCDEKDYAQALAALRIRKYSIAPSTRLSMTHRSIKPSLLCRMAYKQTAGFDIDPASLKFARDRMQGCLTSENALLTARTLYDLQKRYYGHDDIAKAIHILNFLPFLACLEQHKDYLPYLEKFGWEYLRLVAGEGKKHSAGGIIAHVLNHPSCMPQILAFMHGMFLYKWVKGDPRFQAYEFPFNLDHHATRPSVSFCPQPELPVRATSSCIEDVAKKMLLFSKEANFFDTPQSAYYLFLDGPPEKVMMACIRSWPKLAFILPDLPGQHFPDCLFVHLPIAEEFSSVSLQMISAQYMRLWEIPNRAFLLHFLDKGKKGAKAFLEFLLNEHAEGRGAFVDAPSVIQQLHRLHLKRYAEEMQRVGNNDMALLFKCLHAFMKCGEDQKCYHEVFDYYNKQKWIYPPFSKLMEVLKYHKELKFAFDQSVLALLSSVVKGPGKVALPLLYGCFIALEAQGIIPPELATALIPFNKDIKTVVKQ